uniref:DNA ligase (NAD(+)) n=1 Tax=viral metagenome TaxID=1070528 RepID=A0A6C0BVX1_9ZZZZ
MLTTEELIANYAKNGFGLHMKESVCADMLRIAAKNYYNATPLLSDAAFDELKDFIAENWPSAAVLSEIGAPPARNRVKLPHFMGSMDKIKSDVGLSKWATIYAEPYVISAKLDGVSGMIDFGRHRMYTRGDGNIGQDVTPLLSLVNIGNPTNTTGLCVRGEFIMKPETFERKYQPLGASNPRNLVSGIVNSKIADPSKCADVDFICYEVLSPAGLSQSEQLKLLASHGFNVVYNNGVFKKSQLTADFLTNLILVWKQCMVEYEIDGVIITCDASAFPHKSSGNPEHSVAFKTASGGQEAEVTVTDVIWTPSQDGYLKPRVRIEPTSIGGVVVEYATGFNGAFIRDSGIGPGAVVRLIRSGDVIPYIVETITPVPPKMPAADMGEYAWTSSDIDIVLVNPEDSAIVREKNIAGFFTSLGVDGLSAGNVKRLMNAGFDTIKKILDMTHGDFLKVDGFKDKMAAKLSTNIREKFASATIQQILIGSNLIGRGFGEKKIAKIFQDYPNVLEERNVAKLAAIPGFSQKTAAEFIENVPRFMAFLGEIGWEGGMAGLVAQMPVVVGGMAGDKPLAGKSIALTGFRDKELEATIVASGGNVTGTVSKNTFALIVKSKEDCGSTKYQSAIKYGVPVYTQQEFKQLPQLGL